MIRGIHAMFYTPEPEKVRQFFKEKIRFPFVDVGEGWLIFDAPAAEIGCHPSKKRFHGLSFYCDDLERTVETLRKRGVKFATGITDEEWGRVTTSRFRGAVRSSCINPSTPSLKHDVALVAAGKVDP